MIYRYDETAMSLEAAYYLGDDVLTLCLKPCCMVSEKQAKLFCEIENLNRYVLLQVQKYSKVVKGLFYLL